MMAKKPTLEQLKKKAIKAGKYSDIFPAKTKKAPGGKLKPGMPGYAGKGGTGFANSEGGKMGKSKIGANKAKSHAGQYQAWNPSMDTPF